jgi:molybdopterin converting factor subunit 1
MGVWRRFPEIRMITVHVRLFAGLHQLIGEREIEMRLPDGATIAVLRDTLGQQHPVVEALLPTLVCAIDEEYVEPSQVLADGDHVALIPPVSGGSVRRWRHPDGRGEPRPYATGSRRWTMEAC